MAKQKETTVKLSKLKPNKDNPRKITPAKLNKLKEDIAFYPGGLALQPIVVDDYESWTVISGNQRLKALKGLGYKEIPKEWVISAAEATEEQRRFITVKFNDHAGQWDQEILEALWPEFGEWTDTQPGEWDTEKSGEPVDYSDKNKEIDLDSESGLMILKLEYTIEDYEKVKTGLHRISSTCEDAVWKLLKL